MKDWWKNIKVLWSMITLLGGGLVTMIVINLTYQPEINRLRLENMMQDSTLTVINQCRISFEYMNREWRWTIEEALKRADLIYFESGILKLKGEE